jgi:hypothetical protein
MEKHKLDVTSVDVLFMEVAQVPVSLKNSASTFRALQTPESTM